MVAILIETRKFVRIEARSICIKVYVFVYIQH